MKRYNLEVVYDMAEFTEDPDGEWVKYEEVEAAIKEAVDEEIFNRAFIESFH